MGAAAGALLAGAPPPLVSVLAALTATVSTVTHPTSAVVAPGVARTTEQLVVLNAVTGWVLSVGLVLAPALAGVILVFSTPGAVYAAGALALAGATLLVFPLRRLVPPLARDVTAGLRDEVRQLGEGGRALVHAEAPTEVVLVLWR